MKKQLFKISFIFNFLLLLISSIFCIFPNLPVFAFNALPEKSTVSIDYDKITSVTQFFNSTRNFSNSYNNAILPEEYCLRDDYMIFTDNQASQGLCWDFGNNITLTTTIMKQTGEYLDFSEAWMSTALAYCSKNHDFPDALYTYFPSFTEYIPGDGGFFYRQFPEL